MREDQPESPAPTMTMSRSCVTSILIGWLICLPWILEGMVFTIFLNPFDSRVPRRNSQAALASYISREMMELSIQSCAGDILIIYSNGFGLKQVTDKTLVRTDAIKTIVTIPKKETF
jgi:hypothetical protein